MLGAVVFLDQGCSWWCRGAIKPHSMPGRPVGWGPADESKRACSWLTQVRQGTPSLRLIGLTSIFIHWNRLSTKWKAPTTQRHWWEREIYLETFLSHPANLNLFYFKSHIIFICVLVKLVIEIKSLPVSGTPCFKEMIQDGFNVCHACDMRNNWFVLLLARAALWH